MPGMPYIWAKGRFVRKLLSGHTDTHEDTPSRTTEQFNWTTKVKIKRVVLIREVQADDHFPYAIAPVCGYPHIL